MNNKFSSMLHFFKVSQLNTTLNKYGLVLSALVVLSGCASTKVVFTPNDRAEPYIEPATELVEQESKPELPNVELTQELLEQLLLVSFAPYSGDLELSAENAFKAAQTSQDYRLASFAAVTALRTRDYDLAQQGGELWLSLAGDSESNVHSSLTTLILAYLGLNQPELAHQSLTQRDAELDLEEQFEERARLLIRQPADSAVKVAELMVDEHPELADAYLSAAYVADHFRKSEQASQWLEQALVLNPEWDRAALLKARVLQREGKSEERTEFIEAFLQRNPDSVGMRINHAAELARDKQYQQAFDLMQKVVVDEPDNISALNYTAALAEHLEQDQQAIDYYRRILRLEPQNDEVNWSLARFALRDQDYAQAEKYYQQVVGERLYFSAQLQVANMRYHTHGIKEAIYVLSLLEPQTEQDYIDRATTRHYLLMRENQYEEAFAAINETLVYLPDNFDLRYARALVAAEIKEVETAEKDLRFVIDKEPENADALNALGYTLADQTDRLEEAKDLIAKALELRPESPHILDSMGWVLYRLGDLEGAQDYLSQAFAIQQQAEIAAHLGEVLWEQGKHAEAKQIWRQGIEDDADNPVLLATLERYGQGVEELLALAA